MERVQSCLQKVILIVGLLAPSFFLTVPSLRSLLELCHGKCRYASLYFCMCIDQEDNELEVLEIIHHYVEVLDRYFGSVSCETNFLSNQSSVTNAGVGCIADFFILNVFCPGL